MNGNHGVNVLNHRSVANAPYRIQIATYASGNSMKEVAAIVTLRARSMHFEVATYVGGRLVSRMLTATITKAIHAYNDIDLAAVAPLPTPK